MKELVLGVLLAAAQVTESPPPVPPAAGGGSETAPARAFSAYENSVGTGQIHLWFDRPVGGWSHGGAREA